MVVKPKPLTPRRTRKAGISFWRLWLDLAAIATWGVLLLKYWVTDKLNALLHPDYMWLPVAAGIIFLGLSGWRGWQLWQAAAEQIRHRRRRSRSAASLRNPAPGAMTSRLLAASAQPHFNLFPTGFASTLLLIVALIGLQFTPRPFSSQVALERGVTDTLTMTRSQPQAFRGATRPEDKSVIDWVRTLSVYPEPDAYSGQQANVEGFIIHPPEVPDNYLMIARFVITCCAADVYPVALPVKLPGDRSDYPADQWFRVEGEMITETLNDQRQLVIQASQLTEIPEPKNPYAY